MDLPQVSWSIDAIVYCIFAHNYNKINTQYVFLKVQIICVRVKHIHQRKTTWIDEDKISRNNNSFFLFLRWKNYEGSQQYIMVLSYFFQPLFSLNNSGFTGRHHIYYKKKKKKWDPFLIKYNFFFLCVFSSPVVSSRMCLFRWTFRNS